MAKRWLKRILLGIAVVLVVVLALSGWGWHLMRGTPDWYTLLPQLSDEERQAAANRGECSDHCAK
jgi:hypothetical protein